MPLFRHCTRDELESLRQICRTSRITRSQEFDLKKLNSLNIIIQGIFEIEIHGKTDCIYLTPGSFFGSLPFTSIRNYGKIKAKTDAEIYVFGLEDLYKFFLTYYKALRGYLQSVSLLGIEISPAVKDMYIKNSSIITVFSEHGNSGTTLFAGLLGYTLSGEEKTIVLDMSYSGNSIFNVFEKKITPALSQKQMENSSNEEIIFERIENVTESLSLLNVVFGSQVRVDPDILSPLLFLLSKKYRYIILDLSNVDQELRNRAFNISDTIYALLKKPKDSGSLFQLMDNTVTEFPRVYYVINRHFAGESKSFEGGFSLGSVPVNRDIPVIDSFAQILEQDKTTFDFIKLLLKPKRGLVLQGSLFDSIAYAGIFKAMLQSSVEYSTLYSSAFSYFLITCYLLHQDETGFLKEIKRFYESNLTTTLLDITFPEENIFRNNRILKFCSDIAGSSRIEYFKNLPLMLGSDTHNEKRIFSTGYLSNLLAASFVMAPIFEPVKSHGSFYTNGYPLYQPAIADLFRTDTRNVFYSYISGHNQSIQQGKTINFFDKYIEYVYQQQHIDSLTNNFSNYIEIAIDEKEKDHNKIILNAEGQALKRMKDLNIL
jgi:hypothetical protein